MNYGYARVSSKDQNLERQLLALEKFGIPERCIYVDRKSGKDFDRPGYKKLVRRLKPEDVLVIGSIDRLGRNYEEILNQWRIITKAKMADVVVMDMPLLDTRKKDADLTGTFISDLVLQILSYVAETERSYIKKRQAEGIAAARERGVQFGRPRLQIPDEFDQCKTLYTSRQITSREAADMLQVSQPTFLRWFAL